MYLSLKKYQKNIFSFYLAGMPFIFFSSCFVSLFNNSLNEMMIGFLLIYLFTILYTIFFFGLYTIYAIYLYTSAFFIYDCFFFSVFKNKNFLIQTFPIRYELSQKTGAIFIIICFVSVYIMHLTYCLVKNNKYKFEEKKTIESSNLIWEKIGSLLMLIFLIPVLYKIYLQVTFISLNGYLVIFNGELETLKYPFWCTGAFVFFTIGYVIFFSSNPSKKKFIVFTILFFIVYGLNSLNGQRTGIISQLLVIIFIISQKYKIKIKIKQIFLLLCMIILVIISLDNIRSNYGNKSKNTKIKISAKIIENFFYEQTASRAVPMLIIEKDLEFHHYPFIFSPLLTPYYQLFYPSSGQTVLSAEKHNNISQVTMYNVSKKAHLNGNGYGGSFLAEAYDCGGVIGVIIWSIILGIILFQYDFKFNKISPKIMPFAFYYLLVLPTLPRGRTFGFMNSYLQIVVLYIVLSIIGLKKYIKNIS